MSHSDLLQACNCQIPFIDIAIITSYSSIYVFGLLVINTDLKPAWLLNF